MSLKVVFEAIFVVALIVTPILNGVAWWFWIPRAAPGLAGWRPKVLLVGLVLASINTAVFYAWLAIRLALGGTPGVWRAEKTCADLAVFLVLAALVGAVVGKGKSRVLLSLCAFLGFILWLPVGIGIL